LKRTSDRFEGALKEFLISSQKFFKGRREGGQGLSEGEFVASDEGSYFRVEKESMGQLLTQNEELRSYSRESGQFFDTVESEWLNSDLQKFFPPPEPTPPTTDQQHGNVETQNEGLAEEDMIYNTPYEIQENLPEPQPITPADPTGAQKEELSDLVQLSDNCTAQIEVANGFLSMMMHDMQQMESNQQSQENQEVTHPDSSHRVETDIPAPKPPKATHHTTTEQQDDGGHINL
jgi:hypothetical protein